MNYRIEILENYEIPYIIIKKNFKRVSVKYNQNCVLEIRQPLKFPNVEMIKFIEKQSNYCKYRTKLYYIQIKL